MSIVTNPQILNGKPCIAGTRIAVEHILKMLDSGMTYEEILNDFPELTTENIMESILFTS